MRLLVIMDPLERVNIDADTSFALMLAAQARGHTLAWTQMHELGSRGTKPFAWARSVTVRRERGRHFTEERAGFADLADFDVVLVRTDPPFDQAYLHGTHLLSLCDPARTRVYNSPGGLREANEHLFALRFPELGPDTLVTSNRARLLEFVEEVGGTAILKPVDGHGGFGVLLLRKGDSNVRALLDLMSAEGRRLVMAQRYIPEVTRGDKRVFMVNGEYAGALLRVPASGEHRANIHVGGSVQATSLDPREVAACERLGPALRAAGLVFVGLDFVGGFLTEVNVTSPTGVQEILRLSGVDVAERFIRWLEDGGR